MIKSHPYNGFASAGVNSHRNPVDPFYVLNSADQTTVLGALRNKFPNSGFECRPEQFAPKPNKTHTEILERGLSRNPRFVDTIEDLNKRRIPKVDLPFTNVAHLRGPFSYQFDAGCRAGRCVEPAASAHEYAENLTKHMT